MLKFHLKREENVFPSTFVCRKPFRPNSASYYHFNPDTKGGLDGSTL